MVANVRCIVAGAAGSLKRRNSAGNQAASCDVVVDACDLADGNLQGIEESLTTTNRDPRGVPIAVTDLRPFVVQVENVGCKLPVPWRRHPTRLFESGNQEVDAGIQERKSTRLNSSHVASSYAVCCVKKKKSTH